MFKKIFVNESKMDIFEAIENDNIEYVINNYDEHKQEEKTINELTDVPLTYMCRTNKREMIKHLLKNNKNIDVNITTSNSHTALRIATNHCYTTIVRLLLENGAEPDKNTPLIIASERGFLEIIKLLLDNGARSKHKKRQWK